MEIRYLLKGLIVGFVIAVPIGPIGILCARRTLTQGRMAGLVSGMGAATADVFYGFIAAFGLAFISDILLSYQFWLRLAGGAFLCFLGIRTFIEKPEIKRLFSMLRKKKRHAGMYTSTFFLTLMNPMTIFSLAAVFAGLGLAGANGDILSALILVLGVFLGSVLWWLLLFGVFSVFKRRFNRREMQRINRIAGMIIMGFGLLAFASLLVP
jgi:threonine/homoserine/homoserine lactone efflux protein